MPILRRVTAPTPPLPLPSRLPVGAWTLSLRIATLLASIAVTFLAPTLATMVLPPTGSGSGGTTVIVEKSILLLCVLVAGIAASRPFSGAQVGIRSMSARAWLTWTLGGFLVLNIASLIWDRIFDAPPGGKALAELGFGQNTSTDVMLILAIAVIAPVAEELLFRGMFHRAARDTALRFVRPSVAIGLATVASSWFFQSIHGSPDQERMIPMYLLYGAVTALAYEFTGSLLAPVAIHTATNTFAIVHGALDGTGPGLSAPWLVAFAVAAPLLGVAMTLLLGRLLDLVGGRPAPAPA